MRKIGTLKWWSDQKHFGFLISHDEDREYFAHVNDFQGAIPKQGVQFEFSVGADRSGRTKAIKIVSVSEVKNDDSNK